MSAIKIHKTAFVAGILGLALSAPAFAVQQGDWIVRFGAANVSPNDSSGHVGSIAGSSVSVGDDTQAFVNLSYMMTDNVAVELLASTPFKHDVHAEGSIKALGKIAEVHHLPPTLSLQYHVAPKASVRPYVGAGVNYTIFFDENAKGGVVTDINLDNSLGLAVQGGVDVDISKNWFFNADVRYIWISTTATTNVGKVDVDINPWVFSLGIGTRF